MDRISILPILFRYVYCSNLHGLRGRLAAGSLRVNTVGRMYLAINLRVIPHPGPPGAHIWATRSASNDSRKSVAPPPEVLSQGMRFFQNILLTGFIAFVALPPTSCQKKEEGNDESTYLLLAAAAASASRTFAGSCNKFSVNSTCINSYGTFVASSCTGQGGTVGSSRCSALTNLGSCSSNSGATQTVYYSGGTSPVCNSTGTCSTDCTTVLGTYSSTYSP